MDAILEAARRGAANALGSDTPEIDIRPVAKGMRVRDAVRMAATAVGQASVFADPAERFCPAEALRSAAFLRCLSAACDEAAKTSGIERLSANAANLIRLADRAGWGDPVSLPARKSNAGLATSWSDHAEELMETVHRHVGHAVRSRNAGVLEGYASEIRSSMGDEAVPFAELCEHVAKLVRNGVDAVGEYDDGLAMAAARTAVAGASREMLAGKLLGIAYEPLDSSPMTLGGAETARLADSLSKVLAGPSPVTPEAILGAMRGRRDVLFSAEFRLTLGEVMVWAAAAIPPPVRTDVAVAMSHSALHNIGRLKAAVALAHETTVMSGDIHPSEGWSDTPIREAFATGMLAAATVGGVKGAFMAASAAIDAVHAVSQVAGSLDARVQGLLTDVMMAAASVEHALPQCDVEEFALAGLDVCRGRGKVSDELNELAGGLSIASVPAMSSAGVMAAAKYVMPPQESANDKGLGR